MVGKFLTPPPESFLFKELFDHDLHGANITLQKNNFKYGLDVHKRSLPKLSLEPLGNEVSVLSLSLSLRCATPDNRKN